MESVLNTIRQFTHDQFSNENRLKARMQLYQYCEHKTNWHQWVFDHLDFTNVTDVLEIGCGNGALWRENTSRIPEGISIILSDISEGMVVAARQALSGYDNRFQFEVVDACRTPYIDGAFQMITAIHVIFHIHGNTRIFLEIDRLLADNGFAYATEPSRAYFQQMANIAAGFNQSLAFDDDLIRGFVLENGEEVLSGYFPVIEKFIYQNDVVLKTSEPLLLYLASIYEGKQLDLYAKNLSDFKNYIESIITGTGAIRFTNKAALFKFGKR